MAKRRRLLAAAKEPARWMLCFGAAGLLHGYAYLHHLGPSLGPGATDRPDAVRVRLVSPTRMPPMLRRRPEQDDQTGHVTLRRASPASREPVGDNGARKLLEEARLKDSPLEMSPGALRDRIEEGARRHIAEGVKNPEKAMARADKLSRGVSAESAREIADYLGYQGGDYVPRKPPPPGHFDFDDCILYDLVKAQWPDGPPTYRVTMVDKEGRSHVFLVPPGENPASYDTFYTLLQTAKRNPSLRVILRRMVLPLTSKLVRSMRQQKRPAPRTPPPPKPPAPPPVQAPQKH